eukprot:230902_1
MMMQILGKPSEEVYQETAPLLLQEGLAYDQLDDAIAQKLPVNLRLPPTSLTSAPGDIDVFLKEKIPQPEFEQLRDLIKQLLTFDPKARLTAENAMKHDFVTTKPTGTVSDLEFIPDPSNNSSPNSSTSWTTALSAAMTSKTALYSFVAAVITAIPLTYYKFRSAAKTAASAMDRGALVKKLRPSSSSSPSSAPLLSPSTDATRSQLMDFFKSLIKNSSD